MVGLDIFEEIKKELQSQTKIETAPLSNDEDENRERLSFINEYILA